jgi:hypothetical protein
MTTASTITFDWDHTELRYARRPALPADGLSGDLEKAMQRIVRRIIRRGEAKSFVDGRVLAAAESLIRRSSTLPTDRDRLVSRVARRLCEMLRAHMAGESTQQGSTAG